MQAIQQQQFNYRTYNGLKLRIAGDHEKERRGSIPVLVKNRGDRDINWEFDGQLYRLCKKSQRMYPSNMVWHILGDPDLRPGMRNSPVRGTLKTWAQQVGDLENIWGLWHAVRSVDPNNPWRYERDPDSNWQYILNGDLYCFAPELGWGRGKDFYSVASADTVRSVFVGDDPLTEDGMETRYSRSAKEGRAVNVAADPLTEDEYEDSFLPKPKGR